MKFRLTGLVAATLGAVIALVALSSEIAILFSYRAETLVQAVQDSSGLETCRTLAGRQFAASLPGSVLGLLITSYLLIDSILLFIVDITFHFRSEQLEAAATENAVKKDGNGVSNLDRAVLSVLATTVSIRWTRFSVAVILVVLLVILRIFTNQGYMTDQNCPLPDAGIVTLEIVNIVLMVVVIISVPLIRALTWGQLSWLNDYVASATSTTKATAIPNALRTSLWLLVVSLGLLCSIVAQWSVCIAIGDGWAKSITTPSDVKGTAEEWTTAWVQRTTSLSVVAILSGFILALVMGRWLFPMATRTNMFILLIWGVVVLVGVLGLLFIDSGSVVPEGSTALCDQLAIDQAFCIAEYGLKMAGAAILLLTVLLMLLCCCLRNIWPAVKTNPRSTVTTETVVGGERLPLLVMSGQ